MADDSQEMTDSRHSGQGRMILSDVVASLCYVEVDIAQRFLGDTGTDSEEL